MTGNRNDRKLKNFFLDPSAQLKVSFHFMSIVLMTMSVLLILIFTNLSSFVQGLPLYKGNLDEMAHQLKNYITFIMWLSFGVLVVMAIFSFVLSLIVTHRMVGPMVAIRRQIRNLIEGEYSKRVTLRKTDEFHDVAADLNELTTLLEKKSGGK